MLMSFDIDCGELISGHRFIVRGLADCGTLEFDGEAAAGISLEYELVPGVASGTGKRVFDYSVGIEYEADVELPWMAVLVLRSRRCRPRGQGSSAKHTCEPAHRASCSRCRGAAKPRVLGPPEGHQVGFWLRTARRDQPSER
jgi:hypothetical protein